MSNCSSGAAAVTLKVASGDTATNLVNDATMDAGPAGEWHAIEPSIMSQRSKNPIRRIIEGMKTRVLTDKPLLTLSLGDPTVFGNLPPPAVLVDAVAAMVSDGRHDGYIHSAGTVEARAAVAAYMSVAGHPSLTAEDVVIASGCSGALDLAINVLLNPGDTLLLPKPAFALYATLCEARGIRIAYYNLLPERGWEADLDHMESLIDGTCRAILVNNPSNPCGSVYSEAHLRAIIALAEKHRLPIIADEIYGHIVFTGHAFHPMAQLSDRVPILATSGLAKEYLVPGWRVGWVAIHDRGGVFAHVRKGLFALSQLLLGANAPMTHALPAVLTPAAGSDAEASLLAFRRDTVALLESHAAFAGQRLARIPGLHVMQPQGAMYLFFGIDMEQFEGVDDDLDFARQLLAEQNVSILPGSAFNMPNFCRIVFCPPKDVLEDACDRIAEFCASRYRGAAAAAVSLK